jgi:hypothetical protein
MRTRVIVLAFTAVALALTILYIARQHVTGVSPNGRVADSHPSVDHPDVHQSRNRLKDPPVVSRPESQPGLASSPPTTTTPAEPYPLVAEELSKIVSTLQPELDSRAAEKALIRLEAKQVWKAQAKIRSTWPAYEKVREALGNELAAIIDLRNASTDDLVRMALDSRKRFWDAGGDFSPAAYRDIYKSRFLLEMAHERNPAALDIADELVESLQSAHPVAIFENDTMDVIRDTEVETRLTSIRSKQLDQIRKEIDQGRPPTWKDFVRSYDVVVLLSGKRHSQADKDTASEIVDWQLREAERGGWTGYQEHLLKCRESLHKGDGYSFPLYKITKAKYPEEYRYGMRLPSFLGDNLDGRGVIRWWDH